MRLLECNIYQYYIKYVVMLLEFVLCHGVVPVKHLYPAMHVLCLGLYITYFHFANSEFE